MFVRSAYNYDRDEASRESGWETDKPSRTQQNFGEECDINTIVRRFGLGYKLPESFRTPTYGDFTGIDNYQDALHAVMAAGDEFMKVPAEVRYRFNNDPAEFVAFCSDERNRAEMDKLGLLSTKPSAQVVPESVVLAAAGQAPQGPAGTTPAGVQPPAGAV